MSVPALPAPDEAGPDEAGPVDPDALFVAPDENMTRGAQQNVVAQQCRQALRVLDDIRAAGGDIALAYRLARRASTLRITVRKRALGPATELLVTELCRLTERALMQSITAARERGELLRKGQIPTRPSCAGRATLGDYGLSKSYLGAVGVAIGAADDTDFEDAIAACRDNGDLSRPALTARLANTSHTSARAAAHLHTIRRMAGLQFSSAAIAARMGIGETRVRRLARAAAIDIPGDRRGDSTVRVDPRRIVEHATTTLASFPSSLALLTSATLDALTPQECDTWAQSLTPPLRALRALHKELTRRAHQ